MEEQAKPSKRALDPAQPRRKDKAVRDHPFPFNAWLALANDPDNTLIKDWRELDRVIWKELELPFADSLFFQSFNKNLKEQVDLHGYPEILGSHPHDTIHTWGDFLFGGARGFEREDAIRYADLARKLGFTPRVWVDHSMFTGNLLHNHRGGSIPEIRDASGHTYPNPLYSLDIIHEVGVRYVWDGTITSILGQDRPIAWWRYHVERTGDAKRAGIDFTKHRVGELLGVGSGFRAQFQDNSVYRPFRFPDGRVLYVFQRHGRWEQADITGLGDLLSPTQMDRLIANGGVCVAYTHLGKRPVARMGDPVHIPERTVAALQHVKKRFKEGSLMVSPLSYLLDHLVLRDHIRIDRSRMCIEFEADGIAFEEVDTGTLAGHSFSFNMKGTDLEKFTIQGTNGRLYPSVEHNNGSCSTLHFEGR